MKVKVQTDATQSVMCRQTKIHSTVPPESTDLDNTLIFTFGPTLQFEWVTMKQGCFSTAGTLTGSGTFIVGTVW